MAKRIRCAIYDRVSTEIQAEIGTAGKNSKNYKISLPADMVRELGVTEEDRSVILTSEDGKVIIEKDTPGKRPRGFAYTFLSFPFFASAQSLLFCAAVPVYPLIPFAAAIFLRFAMLLSTPIDFRPSTMDAELNFA